jgi:hypothetical protein
MDHATWPLCPGMTYPEPDPKQLETVQARFDGAPCG